VFAFVYLPLLQDASCCPDTVSNIQERIGMWVDVEGMWMEMEMPCQPETFK